MLMLRPLLLRMDRLLGGVGRTFTGREGAVPSVIASCNSIAAMCRL